MNSSLFGLSPREDTQLFPYGYPLAFYPILFWAQSANLGYLVKISTFAS